LPDFQGLGFGTRISEAIGETLINRGEKFFSRSTHVRLGRHRRESTLWSETATSGKKRTKVNDDIADKKIKIKFDDKRIAHSFEYVGEMAKLPRNYIGVEISHDNENEYILKRVKDKLQEYAYNIIVTGIASKQEMNIVEKFALENGIRTEIMFIKSRGILRPNARTLNNVEEVLVYPMDYKSKLGYPHYLNYTEEVKI